MADLAHLLPGPPSCSRQTYTLCPFSGQEARLPVLIPTSWLPQPVKTRTHTPAPHHQESILKEINPEYSLEGMMLKLMPQYFGLLMQSQVIRKDPNAGNDWRQEEKGTTEDEMVRWRHQFNGHLSKVWEVVDRGTWRAAVHGVSKKQKRLGEWITTTRIQSSLLRCDQFVDWGWARGLPYGTCGAATQGGDLAATSQPETPQGPHRQTLTLPMAHTHVQILPSPWPMPMYKFSPGAEWSLGLERDAPWTHFRFWHAELKVYTHGLSC